MKKSLAFAAVAAALFASGSAFAAAGTPYCAQVTRSDVLKSFEEWRSNPVAADGARWVGGDVGWSADASLGGAAVSSDQGGAKAAGDLRLVPGELGWVSAQNDLRVAPAAANTTSTAAAAPQRGYEADSGWRLAYGELGLIPAPSAKTMRGSIAGCIADGLPSMAHAGR